jgi:hypothetical protein
MRNFLEENHPAARAFNGRSFLPLHTEPDPNFVHPQIQALSMGHHNPQPQSLQNELDRLRNHRKKKRVKKGSRRLRQETTMTLKWMADRLKMGNGLT